LSSICPCMSWEIFWSFWYHYCVVLRNESSIYFIPFHFWKDWHRIVLFAPFMLSWIQNLSWMVTRVPEQTALALWVQNLSETLKPQLAEIKHKGELKFWHPEPILHGKLLHATLHWENRRPETTNTWQLQACLGDIRQTKQVSP
jgi:hypothetical protein